MPDDYSALGGMDAIRATGLRVPEDISITGYDGVAMIQMCQPQLTTVEQDVFKIGREAARKLVHLIEQPAHDAPRNRFRSLPSHHGRHSRKAGLMCDSPSAE